MKARTEPIQIAAVLLLLAAIVYMALPSRAVQGFSWRELFGIKKQVQPAKPQVITPVPITRTITPLAAAAKKPSAKLEGPIPSNLDLGKSAKVLVLMYHHVGDLSIEKRQRDHTASDLTVSPTDFESQIKYFRDQGYKSITVQKLYDHLNTGEALPAKPIIFTFDDGYADVFANAIPTLQKYGYIGSFAIATELLGRPSYGVWDNVVAADRASMEILSHTENHLDLTSPVYSAADLRREIFGAKEILESKLGHPVNFFVYPYGHYNAHIEDLLDKAGYKMAFTTKFGTVMRSKTMLSEPRVRIHGINGLEKFRKLVETKAAPSVPASRNP
jgi:peptidoglycan/xylan/chitin deacetylase (PgdA/CDA1 family)